MESTNGGRPGGPGGVTNGTNGESHAANGMENGRVMAQVGENLSFQRWLYSLTYTPPPHPPPPPPPFRS
jgi:hypothetical protein